jgi:hypothetical protein
MAQLSEIVENFKKKRDELAKKLTIEYNHSSYYVFLKVQ